ncbi:pilus assembly protein PilS [Neisseria meningitidis]|nr:pilus assembly protein PilS [Neisseria meningitidis]MBG8626128.1 pilus assembly protein PilS [Neisseria meningitidis]MBG8659356.1 pilus assembly protein PilS [Neisseria meningitidis]MBG8744527.1 pilus assembly protein PilS [Neisseria meningitidis]MBG8767154.1 pilus assembly protein PilS [Neisseria meningitidis]
MPSFPRRRESILGFSVTAFQISGSVNSTMDSRLRGNDGKVKFLAFCF